jgi:hypothetical protein
LPVFGGIARSIRSRAPSLSRHDSSSVIVPPEFGFS